MITKVKLTNWKSHRETEVNLGDGTNVLVGMMGAGKSLPYQEPIIAKYNGKWGKYPIGEIVENALKNAKEVQVYHDTAVTSDNHQQICVFCLNTNTLKVEPREVKAFLKHGSPSALVKLRTRTGKSITVTEDHSLLIINDSGEIESRKGSEVKVGDYLLAISILRIPAKAMAINTSEILPELRSTTEISRGLEIMSNGFSPKKASSIVNMSPHVLENWKRRGMSHEPGFIIGRDTRSAVPTEMALSNEFAVLGGTYLSEGCSRYDMKKPTYDFRITSRDSRVLEKIEKCWERVFPTMRYKVSKEGFRASPRVVAALFTKLFGSNSSVKKIPNFLYEAEEEFLSVFLGAYFDGDGWVVPHKTEVACVSKSLDLIDGLQTLLLRWGVMGKIGVKNVRGVPYYELRVLTKHVPLLSKHLKFLTRKKQVKLLNTARIVGSKKRWDGIDIIPNVKKLLRSLRLEYHLCSRKKQRAYALSTELAQYMCCQNIGREKLKRCLQEIFEIYGFKSKSFRELKRIVDSDIFFDKIVEIQKVQPTSGWVYDLSVEGMENFVAGIGNLIVHNSAVLDGITYALFGTLPAVKARRIKLEELISSRPRLEERAEVEVSFRTAEGDEFVVKRGIARGKGTVTSELRKESGELVESGSSDLVTENIRRLLKIDYDIYERAIYAEQNRLDYFLTIPKGKRMDHMDELLGINKLENARKGMGTLANRLVGRAEDLEMRAKQLKQDESLARLPEIEKEVRDLEKSVEENQQRLGKLKEELEQAVARYEEFRKMERDISDLNGKFLQLQATTTELEGQVESHVRDLGDRAQMSFAELQQLTAMIEEDYRKKDSALQKLNSDFTAASVQLKSLEETEKRLEQEVKLLEQEIQRLREVGKEVERLKPAELEAGVAKSEDEYGRLLAEQAAADARLKDLKKSMDELSKAKAVCPVCDSPLEDSKKDQLIGKKSGEIVALEGKVKEAGGDAARVKKEWDERRQLLQKARLLGKEVESLPEREAEFSKRQAELQEAGQKLPALKTGLSDMEKTVAQARGEAEKSQLDYLEAKRKMEIRKVVDAIRSRLRQTEVEKLEVRQKLDVLKGRFDESRLKELETRKGELSTDYGRLEEQIRGDRTLAEAKRSTAEEIKGKIATIRRFEVESKHLRGASTALGTIQTAINKTQTALRQQFLEGVNVVMADIWESIYPYRDFVGIRLAIEEKGGDYVLQLRDHAGNWIAVDGMASGGERTDGVLALRIAFAMVLAPNLRWIVFDEPTHNLDVQGIEELAKIMRERMPEIVRQIILITHEERLEGAVSGYLYRFYRNKAADEPTRVEQVTVPESFE